MNSVMELKPEYATVSNAVLFDGNDGIEEQRRALQALFSRCANRGLQEAVKKVNQEKRHIEAMEQEGSASAQEGYPSSITEAQGRGDQFRHGIYRDRSYMTVDDFATYYSQCRKSKPTARGEQTAAEAVTAKDCTDSGVILCSTPVKNQNKQDINENPSEKTSLVARVERVAKEWFAPDDRMLRRRTAGKAFPVSLVACFVIIAVSMMLLVSGTVMVAGAKKDVSELKREVAKLSNEAQLLENEFESQIDYLEIYRVATEEYGMVDADFVCGSYLGSETDSYIEVYEKEDDATAGLATLLAAIGIHIGD